MKGKRIDIKKESKNESKKNQTQKNNKDKFIAK